MLQNGKVKINLDWSYWEYFSYEKEYICIKREPNVILYSSIFEV